MVTPTYPGVYVQEVSSGVRPITIASTSTTAFVGISTKGSTTEAVRIFSFSEFEKLYGTFRSDSYLAHAVFQYFNNGGSICYIVRVAGTGAAAAEMVMHDRGTTLQQTLTLSAASPGVWGNELEIEITNGTSDAANEFNLNVYEEGADRPVEAYENLSMLSTASNYVENVITNSPYITVSVATNTNSTSADARGTSVAAGAATLPADVPATETQLRINIDNDGFQDVDLTDGVGGGAGQAADLATAANVATALQFVVRDVLSKNHSTTPDAAYDSFTATQTGGVITLTSGSQAPTSSVVVSPPSDASTDITGFLRLGKLRGGTETIGAAVLRPQANTTAVPRYLLGDHATVGAGQPIFSVTAGSDGAALANDQPYINALSRLDDKPDVSLLTIPGIASPSLFGDAINYCQQRNLSDCFFIGDMPEIYDTVDEAQAFVGGISPKNSYGAVYMPWLTMNDPTGTSSEPVPVPPSGFIAGLYAKTDTLRGVWKAPAGTSAGVAGANGLVASLTNEQQGLLNPTPYHVNVIRDFAASGRVIWGARTITSDAEWNYVPVRRMAIMLRVSIYNGIQWAVFEPNDEGLWSQLRLNIKAFMMTLYRRGAFQGATPDDAFFVKVDSETTSQADIDAGIVNIQVGFAPLKPAEFVVVSLSQKAGQTG